MSYSKGGKRPRKTYSATAMGKPVTIYDDYLLFYASALSNQLNEEIVYHTQIAPVDLCDQGEAIDPDFTPQWRGPADGFYKWKVGKLGFVIQNHLPAGAGGLLAAFIVRNPSVVVDRSTWRKVYQNLANSRDMSSLATTIKPGEKKYIGIPRDDSIYYAPNHELPVNLMSCGRLFVCMYTPITSAYFTTPNPESQTGLYSLNVKGTFEFFERSLSIERAVPEQHPPTTTQPSGSGRPLQDDPGQPSSSTSAPTPGHSVRDESQVNIVAHPLLVVPSDQMGSTNGMYVRNLAGAAPPGLRNKMQRGAQGRPARSQRSVSDIENYNASYFSAPPLYVTDEAFEVTSNAKRLDPRDFTDWLKGCWNTIKSIPGKIHHGLQEIFGEDVGDFIYDLGSDLLVTVGTAALALRDDPNLPPGYHPGPKGQPYCYNDKGWPVEFPLKEEPNQGPKRRAWFGGHVPYKNPSGWIVHPNTAVYNYIKQWVSDIASATSGDPSSIALMRRIKVIMTNLEAQGHFFNFLACSFAEVTTDVVTFLMLDPDTLYQDLIDFDCWVYDDNQIGIYPSWDEPPDISTSPYISELPYTPNVRSITSQEYPSMLEYTGRPEPAVLFFYCHGIDIFHFGILDNAGEIQWMDLDPDVVTRLITSKNVPLQRVSYGNIAPEADDRDARLKFFFNGKAICYQDPVFTGTVNFADPLPFRTMAQFHTLIQSSLNQSGQPSLPYNVFIDCEPCSRDYANALTLRVHYTHLAQNIVEAPFSALTSIPDRMVVHENSFRNPSTGASSLQLVVVHGTFWSPLSINKA